jgi:MFS family permease
VLSNSSLSCARLLVISIALAAISQFHRTYVGTLSLDLTRDLLLSGQMLGFASGAFFFGVGVSQFIVGTAFDRVGIFKTLSVLAVITVAGVLLQSHARTDSSFIGARLLIGVGCAGNVLAGLSLCSKVLDAKALNAFLSYVFAGSQLGVFLASAPFVWISELIGWRGAFVGAALGTALVYFGCLELIRMGDARGPKASRLQVPPEGGVTVPHPAESGMSSKMMGIFALHSVAAATVIVLITLWAAPYVTTAFSFDSTCRGALVTAMAFMQVLGTLTYGHIERFGISRRAATVLGSFVTVALLLVLAALPAFSWQFSVAVLLALPLVGSYSLLLVVHAREINGDGRLGRALGVINFSQVFGLVGLPLFTGLLANSSGGVLPPLSSYCMVFGSLAAVLAVAAVAYASSLGPTWRTRPSST